MGKALQEMKNLSFPSLQQRKQRKQTETPWGMEANCEKHLSALHMDMQLLLIKSII